MLSLNPKILRADSQNSLHYFKIRSRNSYRRKKVKTMTKVHREKAEITAKMLGQEVKEEILNNKLAVIKNRIIQLLKNHLK